MPRFALIFVTTALVACDGAATHSCPEGTEAGHCYGNGTCNAGLTCASHLCVRLGADASSEAGSNPSSGGNSGGSGRNAGANPTEIGDAAAHGSGGAGQGGNAEAAGGGGARGGAGGNAIGGASGSAPSGAGGSTTGAGGGTTGGAGGGTGAGCVAQISAGADHTCARKKDGSVWCWGSANMGELGTGQVSSFSLDPVEVSALGHAVVDVVAGTGRTCVRKTDSTLWCWGVNADGTVGDGTHDGVKCSGNPVCRPTPQQVVGSIGTSVAQVGIMDWSTCACGKDRSLWCWGQSSHGELGVMASGTMCGGDACEPSPVQVTAVGKTAVQVEGSLMNACARLADGTVSCWGSWVAGSNPSGVWPPNAVPMLSSIVQIASGQDHYVALDDKGTVLHFSWTLSSTIISTLLTGAVEVGAGNGDISCARLKDGTVWCSGDNAYGQLGNGTDMGSGTPVKVNGLPAKAVQLSVGTGDRIHSCAVLEDGSAWCWGRNDFGQLGDGTVSRRLSPVQAKICR